MPIIEYTYESWCVKSPHIVIESMSLGTINLGNWESQYAWEKKKFIWKNRAVFTVRKNVCGVLGDNKQP
jgi:hypothetical protein